MSTQSTVRAEAIAFSPPEIKIPPRRDIKTLTSLRLFPAFAVVLYHAGEYFSCWKGVVSSPFVFEYAVTFFFVLSGFILTLNYLKLSDLRGTCKFYLARFARVWPAHASSLALLLFLIPEIFSIKGSAFPMFCSNLFLCQSWIPSWKTYFSYNAPSWTNSTEFFFYICFPFLLWALKKKWWSPVLFAASLTVAVICFCNILKLPEFHPTALSYQGLITIHPLGRILEFACGMLVAVVFQKHLLKLELKTALATALEIGVIAFMIGLNLASKPLRYASIPLLGEAGAFWLQNSALSLFCFSLLIPIFALEKGWISRAMAHPIPVRLGELSFGVYMLHGVILTYLGVNFPQAQSLSVCLTFLLIVLIAAHLMGELLEKPARGAMLGFGNKIIARLFPLASDAQEMQKPGSAENADNARRKNNAAGSQQASSTAIAINSKWNKYFLASELLIFAAIIYLSLPTIKPLSFGEAKALESLSQITSIEFAPYLKLRAAKVENKSKDLSCHFVWQALKNEEVNFTVTAVLLDEKMNPVGSTIYAQDGRRSKVESGQSWYESCKITPFGQAKKFSRVLVSVARNKRETLHYAGGPQNCSFILNFN